MAGGSGGPVEVAVRGRRGGEAATGAPPAAGGGGRRFGRRGHSSSSSSVRVVLLSGFRPSRSLALPSSHAYLTIRVIKLEALIACMHVIKLHAYMLLN